MPYISWSKDNQTNNKKNIFLQKSCRKEGREIFLLFFLKALHEVKASGLQLSFNIFRYPSTWYRLHKSRLHKALHYWSKYMISDVFTPFSAWFFLKPILLYFFNWSNFIAWLPLLHEILDKIRIVTICEPGCDVLCFEINQIKIHYLFDIKLFFLHDQKMNSKI